MLTFEEFFKKKKINLPQLQTAEPALFAEFEQHYNQMGEKSFDHTKKYWFNQLRRKYHTPDEPKVEKLVIENQLAEQTIIDSLSEQSTEPAPKLGFKPKFSTGTKPVEPLESTHVESENKPAQEATPEAPAPKLGFKPKFKTAASSTPAESSPAPTEEKVEATSETPTPKLGFKPKFKSAATPADTTPVAPEETSEPKATEEAPAPKLGFKPKFKSATPKPVEEGTQPTGEIPKTENTPEPQSEPKPAYKPKFQAKNFKPKE